MKRKCATASIEILRKAQHCLVGELAVVAVLREQAVSKRIAAIISCQTSWPRENGMYVNLSINTKNDVFVFDLVKLWFSGILDSINPL